VRGEEVWEGEGGAAGEGGGLDAVFGEDLCVSQCQVPELGLGLEKAEKAGVPKGKLELQLEQLESDVGAVEDPVIPR